MCDLWPFSDRPQVGKDGADGHRRPVGMAHDVAAS